MYSLSLSLHIYIYLFIYKMCVYELYTCSNHNIIINKEECTELHTIDQTELKLH